MSMDERKIRWLHKDARFRKCKEKLETNWIERETKRLDRETKRLDICETLVMHKLARSQNKYKRSMEILGQLYYVNHSLNLYYFKLNRDYIWWPESHKKMKNLLQLQNQLQDEFYKDNPEKLPYVSYNKLNPYSRLLLGISSLINFNCLYNIITEVDLDIPLEPLPVEEVLNSI